MPAGPYRIMPNFKQIVVSSNQWQAADNLRVTGQYQLAKYWFNRRGAYYYTVNGGSESNPLPGAAFTESKLTGARFTEALTLGLQLQACLLVSADLRGLSFRKQRLQGLRLNAADLSGCDFSDAVLIDCDLSDAHLKNARFTRADLRRAQLGTVQIGDLLQHYKGCTLSVDQAATLVAGLGVEVV